MTITSQQRDTDAGSVSRIAKWVPLALTLTLLRPSSASGKG
jgi:hypothetical protein